MPLIKVDADFEESRFCTICSFTDTGDRVCTNCLCTVCGRGSENRGKYALVQCSTCEAAIHENCCAASVLAMHNSGKCKEKPSTPTVEESGSGAGAMTTTAAVNAETTAAASSGGNSPVTGLVNDAFHAGVATQIKKENAEALAEDQNNRRALQTTLTMLNRSDPRVPFSQLHTTAAMFSIGAHGEPSDKQRFHQQSQQPTTTTLQSSSTTSHFSHLNTETAIPVVRGPNGRAFGGWEMKCNDLTERSIGDETAALVRFYKNGESERALKFLLGKRILTAVEFDKKPTSGKHKKKSAAGGDDGSVGGGEHEDEEHNAEDEDEGDGRSGGADDAGREDSDDSEEDDDDGDDGIDIDFASPSAKRKRFEKGTPGGATPSGGSHASPKTTRGSGGGGKATSGAGGGGMSPFEAQRRALIERNKERLLQAMM